MTLKLKKQNHHSSRVETLLNELDWDCEDQSHRIDSLNIIHGYPGSFISSIPGNIIDVFSNENEVVWDPFCGSGISAIESIKKNRIFYGNDINEIAIIITLAKLKLIENFDLFESHSLKLIDFIEVKNAEYAFGVRDNYKSDKKLHSLDDISPWYSKKSMNDLIRLSMILSKFSTPKKLEVIYKAIFLNIARLTSAQQKTWGHIADNVLPNAQQILDKKTDAFASFIQRVLQLRNKGKKIYIPSNQLNYTIENANAREFCPNSKVDLVVTSPPYPQMNDYVTSHRLSYYWLNFSKNDINKIKKNEIGARYRRKSSQKNNNYKADLLGAFNNIISHIKDNGIIAIILPDYVEKDPRRATIYEFYEGLETKLQKLHVIQRKVDSNRWGPFKTLKTELLTIWCKNG